MATPEHLTDRVWTVPNFLSLLRLAAIPVFLWLVLGPQEDVWAGVLLVAVAVTDWADGVIARRTGSASELGRLLDPLADRLTTLAVLAAFGIRGIVPWWFVGVLLLRDVLMTVALWRLRRREIEPLEVSFVGKAATAALLSAFPALLFGGGSGWWAQAWLAYGWAAAAWGVLLYWWSALLYLGQVRRLLAGSQAHVSSRSTA